MIWLQIFLEVLPWLTRLLIPAFLAVPALAFAPLVLSLKATASTLSMQALACPAVLALALAPPALSKRHNKYRFAAAPQV